MLVIPFRKEESGPTVGPPVSLLFPTPATEFAKLSPPVSLHLTIIALVSIRELLPRAMPTMARVLIPMSREATFIQENVSMLLGAIETEHPLLTLATALAEAFRMSIDVFTSGLPVVLAIAFAIAPARVKVDVEASNK